MSGLRRRLQAVETKLAKRPARPGRPGPAPKTAEEWLAAFEAMGREGVFEREPDFPRALASSREAVRDPTSPPYYTHAGRRRPLPERYGGSGFVRVDDEGELIPDGVDACRGTHCRVTSAAQEGWTWLAGMVLRVARGVPTVAEAEFQALTDWLGAALKDVDGASLEEVLIDLRTAFGTIYQAIPLYLWTSMRDGGPRGLDAGQQAEAVRRLQARRVEGGAPNADPAPTGDGSIA
jgi:hypothetical protein